MFRVAFLLFACASPVAAAGTGGWDQGPAPDRMESVCGGGITGTAYSRSTLAADGAAERRWRERTPQGTVEHVARGAVAVAQVRTLFDRLDAEQFATFTAPDDRPMPDAITCGLSVRRGGAEHRVSFRTPVPVLGRRGTPQYEQARIARAREIAIREIMHDMQRAVRENTEPVER